MTVNSHSRPESLSVINDNSAKDVDCIILGLRLLAFTLLE
jgi:hypothetical protein